MHDIQIKKQQVGTEMRVPDWPLPKQKNPTNENATDDHKKFMKVHGKY